MTDFQAAELFRCLERFQAALLEHEEDGATGVRMDHDVRAHLASAEQVIAARLDVYRCLVDQGWQPPARIATDLARDEVVARLAVGAIGA